MKVALFGPWIGEFGWELMTWQAWCRKKSREFDKSYVCSFPDMAPLYEDFATFIPHDHPTRALNWHEEKNYSKAKFDIPTDITDQFIPPKKYRTGGEFIRFGRKREEPGRFRFLIHARGIGRGGKDYPLDQWGKIVELIKKDLPGEIASIGTERDHHIPGTEKLLSIPLNDLMDHMAGAQCVIGQSSGVMHLSSLCTTPHVVWGDSKTYFNEMLDRRYNTTWNPFKTPNSFIFDDDWIPGPEVVAMEVKKLCTANAMKVLPLDPVKTAILPTELRDRLKKAAQATGFMITVSWVDSNTKKLHNYYITRNFDRGDLLPSLDILRSDITRIELSDYKDDIISPQETGISKWT